MAFGLGFIFNSRSKNVRRDLQDTERGLDRVDRSVRRVGEGASGTGKSWDRLVQGFQLHRLNQISSTLERMAEATGNRKLSNGLDALALTVNRDVRKAFVGVNMTQKQIAKLSSQAITMQRTLGIGTEQVINAGKSFEQFGGYAKFGFKDLGSAVKVFEAFGVESADYVRTAEQLANTTGMSAAGVRDLAGEVFLIGKQFGVGSEALKAFTDRGGEMSEMLRLIGDTSPEAAKRTAHSIALLGSAIASSGKVSASEAGSKAFDVFKELQSSAKSWQMAMAGGETPTGLLADLSRFLGPEALDVARQATTDPAILVSRLADQYARLEKIAGPTAKATRVLIANFAEDKLGINLESATKGLRSFNKELPKNAGDALQKAANAALPDTRTLDEKLSQMEEGFDSRLRGILRRDGTLSRFMQHQRAAFKGVGDAASKLAAEDGPLGALTRGLLRVNTFGFQGLFLGSGEASSKLGFLASQLMDIGASITPTATALGAMGLKFHHLMMPVSALLSPLGAVNSILGGLPMAALRFAKIPAMLGLAVAGLGGLSGGGAFSSVTEYVKTKLPTDILRATTGFNDKTFHKRFGKSVSQMIAGGDAWTVIGVGLRSTMARAWEWLGDNFSRGVDVLASAGRWALATSNAALDALLKVDWTSKFKLWYNALSDAIGSTDGSTLMTIGSKIASTVEKALTVGWRFLSGAAGAVFDGLAKWWESMPGGTMDKLKSIWESHGTTIGKALVAGMFLSGGVRSFAFSALGGLLGGLKSMAGSAVSNLANSGVGPGGGQRRDAAGNPIAGSRWMAAKGGAAMGALGGLANLAAGGSVGESIGMTVGGALGGALAGPLGATIGTVGGKYLGMAVEAMLGPTAFEAEAARIRDEYMTADKDRLMRPITGLFDDVMGYTRKLVDAEATRSTKVQAEIADRTSHAEIVGAENDVRRQMLFQQIADAKTLRRTWRDLGKSTTELSSTQRKDLEPMMRHLHDTGKLTDAAWQKFVTEGQLGLRGKELAAFGTEVQRDTGFMANADRRIAQELELKLARIKQEEGSATAGAELARIHAEQGVNRTTKATAAFEGEIGKFDSFYKEFMAGGAYQQIEQRRSAASKAAAAAFAEVTYTRGLDGGRARMKPISENAKDPATRAIAKAAYDAEVSGYSVGPAMEAARAKFVADAEERATNGVAKAMESAAAAAGVELPTEIRELINRGILPLGKNLEGIRIRWRGHIDSLIGEQEKASRAMEAAQFEMVNISIKAREKEAAAIEIATYQRNAAQVFGQLQSEIIASGLSEKAKRAATDDARRIFENPTASFDLFSAQLKFRQDRLGAPRQAMTSDDAGYTENPVGSQQSAAPVGPVTGQATGGAIMSPAIVHDASTNRPIGLVGEAGPEYIVPAGPGGSTLADVIRVFRIEGERTRKAIALSRPKITIRNSGSDATAYL